MYWQTMQGMRSQSDAWHQCQFSVELSYNAWQITFADFDLSVNQWGNPKMHGNYFKVQLSCDTIHG